MIKHFTLSNNFGCNKEIAQTKHSCAIILI